MSAYKLVNSFVLRNLLVEILVKEVEDNPVCVRDIGIFN